jgi:outer membrane protein assembly factor BamB
LGIHLFQIARFVVFITLLVGRANGQIAMEDRLTPMEVDLLGTTPRTHLARAASLDAEEGWREAVEAIQQVRLSHGDELIAAVSPVQPPGFVQYRPVRIECQRSMSELLHSSPKALEAYRSSVDARARRWYEQGVRERDSRLLEKVVDRYFVSSYADDALFALGELAYAEGKFESARRHWERIDQRLRSPAEPLSGLAGPPESPFWLALRQRLPTDELAAALRADSPAGSRTVYKGSDLAPARIHALLALSSIQQGDIPRAAFEVGLFERLYSDARGSWRGRNVDYAPLLSDLLAQAEATRSRPSSASWQSFAKNARRDNAVERRVETRALPNWRVALSDDESSQFVAAERKRHAACHPVLSGSVVFVADEQRIRAFELATGRPWPDGVSGVLFETGFPRGRPRPGTPDPWGAPQYTLTLAAGCLYARVGSPLTTVRADRAGQFRENAAVLVGLDVARGQGRMLRGFPLRTMGSDWAFEGAPVVRDGRLYVALRKSGVRVESHVACYDAQTAQPLWQTYIGSAEPPGLGNADEISNGLLTLVDDTLFFNTNLGVVAALQTDSGRIQWATAYPRAFRNAIRYRESWHGNARPCHYHQGLVIAAPEDSDRVFALDAADGRVLWQTDRGEEFRAHVPTDILGVAGDCLLVASDRLAWFDVFSGRLKAVFPETHAASPTSPAPSPCGAGRGILAGDEILWPTSVGIIYLRQSLDPESRPATSRQVVRFAPTDLAGNLIATDGVLLMATDVALSAMTSRAATDNRSKSSLP